MDQPIVRFVEQMRGHTDCGVSAFAMCFGLSYAQALVMVACVAPRVLTCGITWRDLKKAARKHGAKFKQVTRGIDVEDEDVEGILAVSFIDAGQHISHAVYLKRGFIFDGRTSSVWDAGVYLSVHNADVESLLVRVA